MPFHISKQSAEPVTRQLREQIILSIASGELAIGQQMPSVRELARRLSIHYNSVTRVYNELAREGWLVQHRGSRLIVVNDVRNSQDTHEPGVQNLDDIINRTIFIAQQQGFSLQELASRIQSRLRAEPPNHLLIVAPDPGMGRVMQTEICEAVGYAPPICPLFLLQKNPSVGIGAVLLVPAYLFDRLPVMFAEERNVVPLKYSPMEPMAAEVRQLTEPSVVGVLSVSLAGLRSANGLLAAAIGDRHSLCEFLMEYSGGSESPPIFRAYTVDEHPHTPGVRTTLPRDTSEDEQGMNGMETYSSTDHLPVVSIADVKAVDVLLCDTVTAAIVKHRQQRVYRLLSEKSLQAIIRAAEGLQGNKAKMKAVGR